MKTSVRKLHARRKQAGVSLLEVLIALLITSVGLLGFAGLQSRALLSTEDTYVRTQATSIAQEVVERMRMNGITGATQSNAFTNPSLAAYTTAANWSGAVPAADCLGGTKKCTVAQMALFDIAQIRQVVETSGSLPNGSVLVAACANNRVCAYVAWGSTTAAECAAQGDASVNDCVVIQGT